MPTLAEQNAGLPPLTPAHVQFHELPPVTAGRDPSPQRPLVGAEEYVPPLAVPQIPSAPGGSGGSGGVGTQFGVVKVPVSGTQSAHPPAWIHLPKKHIVEEKE